MKSVTEVVGKKGVGGTRKHNDLAPLRVRVERASHAGIVYGRAEAVRARPARHLEVSG